MFELQESKPTRVRLRFPKDPTPRFRPEVSGQLDSLRGCPDFLVPQEHLARDVWSLVQRFDTSSLEASFSALGRHGFHPRRVLAVLLYGSLIGLHESTKLAAALKTDAALRFLAGGVAISSGTLRRRRQLMASFLPAALQQTVALARELGMLDRVDVAVDSVRLRAHSSTASIRTLARSTERLAELKSVDAEKLGEEQKKIHEEKLAKHQNAVEQCAEKGVTNFVVGNELASLMKLGTGANAPGHRVTMAATGVKERLVLSVFVDASNHDTGKLQPALEEAHRVLDAIGAPQAVPALADAGYWTKQDLAFALSSDDSILIKEPPEPQAKKDAHGKRLFSRERFDLRTDDSVICPAGTMMKGPKPASDGRVKYLGIGCEQCPLKVQCTTGKRREFTVDLELEHLRARMRERFASEPNRYKRRIAIIEPVFSNIESTMGYRRVTTRDPMSLRAEILLKVIAHNLSRLIHRRRVICVEVSVDVF
jgi:transposase